MKSLHQEWWSQLWSILCFSRSLKHPHQNLSNNAFLAPKLCCLSPLKDKGPGKFVQPLAASAASSNLEIQGSRKQQTKLGWCISSFLLATPNLPKNRHAYGLCLARRRPIWAGSKGSTNKRGDKIKEESNNLDIPTAFESVYYRSVCVLTMSWRFMGSLDVWDWAGQFLPPSKCLANLRGNETNLPQTSMPKTNMTIPSVGKYSSGIPKHWFTWTVHCITFACWPQRQEFLFAMCPFCVYQWKVLQESWSWIGTWDCGIKSPLIHCKRQHCMCMCICKYKYTHVHVCTWSLYA